MFRRKPKENLQVEWLFVGLGNPGGEYAATRHNVGYEVIRLLSERHGVKLTTRKFQSHYGVGHIEGRAAALAKPMTFMNRSGIAVAALARHFGVESQNVVIIYDDMDLDVGRVQIRPKGGSGSHNGMRNVIDVLDTQDFPRVRIGIGSPAIAGIEHVLSAFEPDEIETIQDSLKRAAQGCELMCAQGIDIAMNRINKPSDENGR